MDVTSAEQASVRDAAAIAARGESFSLMAAAGTVAAAAIVRAGGDALAHGVEVFVGGGNNGGDGYVVSAQLARLGVRVRVHAVVPPRSPDCRLAAAIASSVLRHGDIAPFVADTPPRIHGRGVLVDALLGTGATGELRAGFAAAAAVINRAREIASLVVALDVPTGVDATTGRLASGYVRAHLTLSFGTCKSGVLSARAACGRVQVLDIGLGAHAQAPDGAPQLATADSLRAVLPGIAWNAHKGTRGRVLIVGGTHGMAGAVQLAAHGALASGAGLVRAAVHAQSVVAVQSTVPAVVTLAWDDAGDGFSADLDEALAVRLAEAASSTTVTLDGAASDWAHAVAIGPGLGRDAQAWRVFVRLLSQVGAGRAALVLDADALALLAEQGRSPGFEQCAETRPVVLTPHAGEFAALAARFGVPFDRTMRDPAARLESARELARALRCVILLKGAPTLCASPHGDAWCVARGSAVLATGGTGDVLTGVLASLLAAEQASRQTASAALSLDAARTVAQAALSAWVHGVAGECRAIIRGRTVMDVVGGIPFAWSRFHEAEVHAPGVLAELPAPGP